MPKISVIVPIYNVERFLEQCVNSILNQTLTDFELILVDDGSSDRCGEICDQYADKDSRIKVIHKENGGQGEARNVGIEASVGDYILFVDGDDYIAHDMVEVLYDRLEQDGSDIVGCNFRIVDENGIRLNDSMQWKPIPSDAVCNNEEFLCMVLKGFITPCKLYRKNVLDGIRFPKDKLCEDIWFAYQVALKSQKASLVERTLYFYVQRTESTMNSPYSIRRLDAVEGFNVILRCLLEDNHLSLCENAVKKIIFLLSEAHQKLDLRKTENKRKYKSLLHEFRSMCGWKLFSSLSLKTKIHFLMFHTNVGLYTTYISIWPKIRGGIRRNDKS